MTTEEILLQANKSLMEINERQSRQISELTEEVKKMAAQIAWFQQQMFGRKSEKHLPADNQPGLFDSQVWKSKDSCRKLGKSRKGRL